MSERVDLLVGHEESERDARRRLGSDLDVEFHRVPLDDVWIRDNGPIFVRSEHNELALTNWKFNSWGGKFEYLKDDEVSAAYMYLLIYPPEKTASR